MRKPLLRLAACCLVLQSTWPAALQAQAQTQPQAGTTSAGEASTFNTEQLDALLAPIALYPDTLLTQILMACTFPVQVVQAARWMDEPAHKSLTGDALAKGLENEAWDPSVKSLVPFPQVLATLNGNLDWTQQLGYAFADQQAAVMDSVQRLRHQAQTNGSLQSTPQQVVGAEEKAIVIEPAQPDVVYVPSYNPSVVYGTWPYPSYPPVYPTYPAAYPVGTALAAGLAFGAGIATTAALWNWARPVWGSGNVNVNVNRYNNINTRGARIDSAVWQPNRAGGRPAGLSRPPRGPVGAPARSGGLPAGAIGRASVSVPGSAVRPPSRPSGAAGRPAAGQPNRPSAQGTRPGNTPSARQQPSPGSRPGGTQARPQSSPGTRAGAGQSSINRSTTQPRVSSNQGAFGGLNQGRQAQQFAQRGGQSRSFSQTPQRSMGGGAASRSSGGGARGGGGRGGGGRGGRR